jgi:hypothetical protein
LEASTMLLSASSATTAKATAVNNATLRFGDASKRLTAGRHYSSHTNRSHSRAYVTC